MGIDINITCDEALSDECVIAESLGGKTLADARYWAKRSGWEIKRGGHSTCPECAWEQNNPNNV